MILQPEMIAHYVIAKKGRIDIQPFSFGRRADMEWSRVGF
jgi:hypothetical protein